VWRRERRGPKGASNRESTPEADTRTIARHGEYKEAEPPDGCVGYPQMDVVRSDLSPRANPSAPLEHDPAPCHALTSASTGSTAARASSKSSGPASRSFAESERIWRKRRPPDRPW